MREGGGDAFFNNPKHHWQPEPVDKIKKPRKIPRVSKYKRENKEKRKRKIELTTEGTRSLEGGGTTNNHQRSRERNQEKNATRPRKE